MLTNLPLLGWGMFPSVLLYICILKVFSLRHLHASYGHLLEFYCVAIVHRALEGRFSPLALCLGLCEVCECRCHPVRWFVPCCIEGLTLLFRKL